MIKVSGLLFQSPSSPVCETSCCSSRRHPTSWSLLPVSMHQTQTYASRSECKNVFKEKIHHIKYVTAYNHFFLILGYNLKTEKDHEYI